MSGDLDIKAIFGGIISLILIIGVILPMFSVMFGLFNNDGKQQEIDGLKQTIVDLQNQNAMRDSQIIQLNAYISSMNQSLDEKEDTISNLTGQISQKEELIQNLSKQLEYYKEKQYLQEINNNYYNISTYFQKIENRFFPIEVSISILSFTLLSIVIKVFGIHLYIKKFYQKYIKKDKNPEVKEGQK